MRSWDYFHSEEPVDHRIFRIRNDLARSPRTGAVHRFVILDAPDWVNVVARTESGLYVMVRQVRHALRVPMTEIPAGMVDPGEDPLTAAQRELREETGFESADWTLLGRIHPNPAFQTNTCHLFLANNCAKMHEPQLDGGEDIQVELWPEERVLGALRGGEISHALVVAAFFLLSPGGAQGRRETDSL